MSPTFQKVVLFALFLPLLERKSVDLKTTPIAIEAESPSLFSALFDLLRLEDQPRREGELASFYEAKRMWKEAGEDPEEILSLLFESLRSLPERYRVRDVKRAGLLCLLSIYADGILQGMSALPKGGAGAKGYLSSRSPLSLEKGRIRFDAPDRSIEKNAFTSWLSNTSFGKILAGELKSESLEDLLSELETEGWIERRGGALFLTPKGLALSAFSIPRMLRLS